MPLSLDYETRSSVDLRKSGVYPYAMHKSTDIWCCAYSAGNGVKLWRPGMPVPQEVIDAVEKDEEICAWNAQFERVIWKFILHPRYGWPLPKTRQWRCTAAEAAAMSLPRALGDAAHVMGIPQQKDREGHLLMMRMARPRAINPDGTYLWWDDEDRQRRLGEYCVKDVEAEQGMAKRLRRLSPEEMEVYWMDQEINDTGIYEDLPLIDACRECVDVAISKLNKRLYEVTSNTAVSATKVADIKAWLATEGHVVDSLSKASVREALSDKEVIGKAREVLEIRAEAGKSSNAKLLAMKNAACPDSRARGLLLYHAAGTGRWGGKLIQPQNMPRGTVDNPEAAIEWIMDRDVEAIDGLFGPTTEVVSSLLRGCLRASPGCRLICADYSSIEGRGLAWLAGEKWKIEAYELNDMGVGPGLYEVSASRIYNVPVELITKKGPRRQIGKVSELAMGYQGGVNAFHNMAANYGVVVSDEEADEIKVAWREANPAIVALWQVCEDAVKSAVKNPGQIISVGDGKLKFRCKGGYLWMILPSGRPLCYPGPKIELVETPWGEMKQAVTYWGTDSKTKKWGKHTLYGGLIVENAVQALCRDIMATAMLRLRAAGYRIVLSVHDEILADVKIGFGSLAEFIRIMSKPIDWCRGFPLYVSADGSFEAERYRK